MKQNVVEFPKLEPVGIKRKLITGSPEVEPFFGKIPDRKVIPNFPKEDNPIIGKCAKCGLDLRRAMYYVCYKEPCGAGLGSRAKL